MSKTTETRSLANATKTARDAAERTTAGEPTMQPNPFEGLHVEPQVRLELRDDQEKGVDLGIEVTCCGRKFRVMSCNLSMCGSFHLVGYATHLREHAVRIGAR